MNISYRNYPSIIKRAGLNGYGNKAVTYRIEAVKEGLSSTEADLLARDAAELGMTVVKIKEG